MRSHHLPGVLLIVAAAGQRRLTWLIGDLAWIFIALITCRFHSTLRNTSTGSASTCSTASLPPGATFITGMRHFR